MESGTFLAPSFSSGKSVWEEAVLQTVASVPTATDATVLGLTGADGSGGTSLHRSVLSCSTCWRRFSLSARSSTARISSRLSLDRSCSRSVSNSASCFSISASICWLRRRSDASSSSSRPTERPSCSVRDESSSKRWFSSTTRAASCLHSCTSDITTCLFSLAHPSAEPTASCVPAPGSAAAVSPFQARHSSSRANVRLAESR